MKITAKTTKEQLVKAINSNFKALDAEKDKGIIDSVKYTAKVFKADKSKVTKKDLADLVKDMMSALGDKFVEPALAEEAPVAETETEEVDVTKTEAPAKDSKTEKKAPKKESSLKSKVGKKADAKKADEEVESESAEEPAKEETEAPAKEEAVKSAKKTGSKKTPAKKTQEAVEVLEESSKVAQQRAKKFPAQIDVSGETYKSAEDITDMGKLYDAVNADEDILLAFYYPKRNIKQFGYFNNLLGTPKSFVNDLDLASVLYVSEEKKVAYAISVYMEAPYTILPEDFEIVDGIKISGALEFEVYRKAE